MDGKEGGRKEQSGGRRWVKTDRPGSQVPGHPVAAQL